MPHGKAHVAEPARASRTQDRLQLPAAGHGADCYCLLLDTGRAATACYWTQDGLLLPATGHRAACYCLPLDTGLARVSRTHGWLLLVRGGITPPSIWMGSGASLCMYCCKRGWSLTTGQSHTQSAAGNPDCAASCPPTQLTTSSVWRM